MTKPERILCISDLHLSPERTDIYNAFRLFLEAEASHASALFILGDFFNVWIGDDDNGGLPDAVLGLLNTLTGSGTQLYLMHGNRDFLLGREFCHACNATLLAEPYLLSCFNSEYLLMHGDSLCTLDSDYMAFRRLVRDPAWQAEFLVRPLADRRAFADEARARSKAMSSNKPEDIMDVTPSEVVRVMKESGATTLVHGHTHRPTIHNVDLGNTRGKRIVLGDWDRLGWYLEITPGNYRLVNFPIDNA